MVPGAILVGMSIAVCVGVVSWLEELATRGAGWVMMRLIDLVDGWVWALLSLIKAWIAWCVGLMVLCVCLAMSCTIMGLCRVLQYVWEYFDSCTRVADTVPQPLSAAPVRSSQRLREKKLRDSNDPFIQ